MKKTRPFSTVLLPLALLSSCLAGGDAQESSNLDTPREADALVEGPALLDPVYEDVGTTSAALATRPVCGAGRCSECDIDVQVDNVVFVHGYASDVAAFPETNAQLFFPGLPSFSKRAAPRATTRPPELKVRARPPR